MELCFFKINDTALQMLQKDCLPSCKSKPELKGFTKQEQKDIVELHNQFRQQVAKGEIKGLPKAKEMLELEWDNGLEQEAQRWADLCPAPGVGESHPPNSWKKFPYGQNVAWGHQKPSDAIQDWIDEYKPYIAKNVDPLIFRSPDDPDRVKHGLGDLGHFTAIVSAKSNKIGCAKVKDSKLEYKVIYVCNYSPPGNIIFLGSDGKAKPLPAYEVDDSKQKHRSATDQKKQKNETVEKESDKPDDPETNQSVHNDKDDAKGKYKEEDEDKDEADTISEEIESSQGKPERRDKPEMGERPEVQEKPEIQAKPNEMKDESETNFRPDTKRYGQQDPGMPYGYRLPNDLGPKQTQYNQGLML